MSDEHRLEELRDELEAQKLPEAVTGLPGRAQEAAHAAREGAEHAARDFSGMIRRKPFVAVLAALGAGYLLGRLT